MHSRREPGFKSHFILSEGDTTSIFLSVESLAISHYQKTEGWSHAVHAEGATFSTLYGVLFWNVVFGVEVPDVFRNAFQVSIVICFAYFTHTHASMHTLPSSLLLIGNLFTPWPYHLQYFQLAWDAK